MLDYLVIAFGLVVVFQLRGISHKLESIRPATRDPNEGFQGTGDKIREEFQWHKDFTFAHALREWLQEIPKDIVEELRWHKNLTFAHELKEWLEEISKDITAELQEATREIVNSLSAIEKNTSNE